MYAHIKSTTVVAVILTSSYALATAAPAFPQQSRIYAVAPQKPSISRVDPPNWWAGNPINPVRLLISGEGLTGARVVSVDPGIKPEGTRVTNEGRYIFVDVRIAPGTKTGPHVLKIITPTGAVNAVLRIDSPLAPTGRFQGFTPDDVIYLVMVDRFADGDTANDNPAEAPGLVSRSDPWTYHGGDLQGVIDHLGYLKDLGVTAIWITPIYQNVNHNTNTDNNSTEIHADYHGYGATDFYAVDPHFGDVAKFRELVEKAHAMGLKIVQDQVANHTGHYHPWVDAPPTTSWFNGSVQDHLSNNWQVWTLTDPHGVPAMRQTTLGGWFGGFLPDLNQNDPEVARYEIQNTLWWIDSTGLDGIREDTMPYVPRSFWEQWTRAIHREHPRVDTVGEVWNGDAAVTAFFQGGRKEQGVDTGVESLFDYPIFYQIRTVFAHNGSFQDLATTLSHDWLYPAPEHLVTFFDNHDNSRFLSEQGADVDGYKLAMTFLLTSRGIPEMFYGDEIGMRGGGDPDNRHDFPGGFPGDTRNAFTASGRTDEENGIFDHVRALTHLRAADAALRRGSMSNLYVAEKQYAFVRTLGDDSCLVAFNTDTKPATIEIDRSGVPAQVLGALNGHLADRLGAGATADISDAAIRVTLPARCGAIFSSR